MARRLFAGYRITAVSRGSGSAVVRFDAAGEELFWRVDVAVPSLRDMPLDAARKELLTFYGVGPKVADCVLLFGLGHTDAFPVDVWIGRALSEIYFGGEKARRQETERAIRALGSESGIVQQYIFHYARQNAIGKKQNAKKIGKKGETVVDTGAALC